MKKEISKYLREYRIASAQALSIQELMEALEVAKEDILLVKNGCEDLVDDGLVERKMAKRKPWYRWVVLDEET